MLCSATCMMRAQFPCCVCSSVQAHAAERCAELLKLAHAAAVSANAAVLSAESAAKEAECASREARTPALIAAASPQAAAVAAAAAERASISCESDY